MKEKRSHKFMLCLSRPEIKRLRSLSEKKGIAISELIRRILDEYLEKTE